MSEFALPQTVVEVYIPGTRNVDVALSPTEHRDYEVAVARRLSRWFGGATAESVRGYYVARDNALVQESIVKVWSFAAPTPAQARAVKRLARWLRARLDQETVLVVIEGKPLLID